MIPWHLVAKAVLPHVADIVSAAGPVFTKRKSGDPASAQPTVLQEQINELHALCYAASAVSLVSLGLALFAVFGR
jgi:hypothetical protein